MDSETPKEYTWMSVHREGISAVRARTGPLEVARRIAEWLRDQDLPIGSRIGDREELAARFHVSSSSVQQAVRILEQGGVLRQRVGVNGGVFLEPKEAEAVAAVLRWSNLAGRLDPAALAEALVELESVIAARAARLATAEDVRRLEEAARADARTARSALGSVGNVEGDVPPSWRLPGMHADSSFHDVLAECSGNVALVLLRKALVFALFGDGERGSRWGGGRAADPDHVTYSHAYIVDAVRMRDAEEAARRARRHVETGLNREGRP